LLIIALRLSALPAHSLVATQAIKQALVVGNVLLMSVSSQCEMNQGELLSMFSGVGAAVRNGADPIDAEQEARRLGISGPITTSQAKLCFRRFPVLATC
jgi:hypothetical protein